MSEDAAKPELPRGLPFDRDLHQWNERKKADASVPKS
jgi:hypothetical protein